MALFIEGGMGNTAWHIGQKAPNLDITRNAISIQADGDELEYILNQFTDIPKSNTVRVMQWFGDHAKFIATNLK